MTVGQIVADTIRFQRVTRCDHEWENLNDTEDRCPKCGVIATEAGKKNLERMRERERPGTHSG